MTEMENEYKFVQ